MKRYDHTRIEKKVQKQWVEDEIYKASNTSKKPKYYALMEFPYPSGDGLHVGHVRGFTAMDIIARKRRAEGYNVMYPIGWDAFGLPTENYAIKTGLQPSLITKRNTDNYRKQFQSLGMSFDWSREINTTDPKYYHWTQWIFLQFLKHDLAYKARMPINWCPKDKTGLANEEVVDGKCERCGTPVEKKEKEQWMLAITKYADRLDKDLDEVNFLDKIKLQQRNWIGRSQGAEISFQLKVNSFEIENTPKIASNETIITVFTTRPDTIFGATYLVVSPEHQLFKNKSLKILNNDEVDAYILQASKKDEHERTDDGKEKTGVELKGVTAINPATHEEIPVWVADYVLGGYGTGAIMAVPADDARDEEFALKYNLPIVRTYTKAGMTDFGRPVTRFKLRDWVFSRQRYWGEPIPVIHCTTCGIVPVPEKDLPVLLPKVKKYEPTDNGESPLADIKSWVNVKCPTCKAPAKRETDTMPNWAGSSWYFLRYMDTKNTKAFAGEKAIKYWNQIDWYNGGMEHTTLHLLYSRFWHKFLFDLKLVPTSEPYQKRTSHGLILADGGEKMSKSKGNVVNPDEIVTRMGADTLRLYEMFIGPFDQAVAWSQNGIVGPRRFIERLWKLQEKVKPKSADSKQTITLLHVTIKKIQDDIEAMSFNTAVSTLMIYVNEMEKLESVSKETFGIFLRLCAPFIPHVTEELYTMIGNKKSIHSESWPICNETLLVADTVKIVIQVNGKTRSTIELSRDTDDIAVRDAVLMLPEINKWVGNNEIVKIVYVPNRLINFVMKHS